MPREQDQEKDALSTTVVTEKKAVEGAMMGEEARRHGTREQGFSVPTLHVGVVSGWDWECCDGEEGSRGLDGHLLRHNINKYQLPIVGIWVTADGHRSGGSYMCNATGHSEMAIPDGNRPRARNVPDQLSEPAPGPGKLPLDDNTRTLLSPLSSSSFLLGQGHFHMCRATLS